VRVVQSLDNFFQSEFNVTTPGMYSIIFSTFDKAGNYKSARSVFLFDDQSVVEKTQGTCIIVTESTALLRDSSWLFL
jgi:hypothetical protein